MYDYKIIGDLRKALEFLVITPDEKLDINKQISERAHNGINKIYQYRPFNVHTRKSLQRGEIHFSKPSLFNDPFDSSVMILGKELNACIITSATSNILREKSNRNEEYILKLQLAMLYNVIDNEKLYAYFNKKNIIKTDSNRIHDIYKEAMISGMQYYLPARSHKDHLNFIDLDDSLKKYNLLFKWNTTMSKHEKNAKKKDIIAKMESDHTEIVKRINLNLNDNIRISSFSSKRNDILMWSHYADNHKGICIEYDLSKCTNLNFIKGLFPVFYSNNRVSFDVENIDFSDVEKFKVVQSNKLTENILYLLLNKYKKWEYENEIRAIVNSQDVNGDGCMSTNMISTIYMGARMDKEDKEIVEMISKEKNYNVREFRLDESKFAIKLK